MNIAGITINNNKINLAYIYNDTVTTAVKNFENIADIAYFMEQLVKKFPKLKNIYIDDNDDMNTGTAIGAALISGFVIVLIKKDIWHAILGLDESKNTIIEQTKEIFNIDAKTEEECISIAILCAGVGAKHEETREEIEVYTNTLNI